VSNIALTLSRFGTQKASALFGDLTDRKVEVAAIDPVASMMAIDTPSLRHTAEELRERLRRAIAAL